MADFDFNNIFGNNPDISNIIFDDNQLSIIRDQFQKEIVNPLFDKYKNLYTKLGDEISKNSNDRLYINSRTDIIGNILDKSKVQVIQQNINRTLEQFSQNVYDHSNKITNNFSDIGMSFISGLNQIFQNSSIDIGGKLNDFKSKLGENFSNFNFLKNIDVTSLNDKLQKKYSEIESNLNVDENITEEKPKKRKSSKLKSRSIPVDFDINQDLAEKLEPVKVENFTPKDFSDELTNNITVLIEETSSNRTLLEKINDSIFSIKSFTSTYFSMFDKMLSDILPSLSENNIGGGNMGLEQKKIGESIPEISLSEKTINQFKNLFSDLFASELFSGLFNLSNLQNLKDDINPFSEKNKSSWLNDIFGGFSSFLLGAGILMLLAGPIWDNFIKPWLEEKTGKTFKDFDEILGRIDQPFKNTAKWFVETGLLLKGVILDNVGKVFKTFADVIDNMDIAAKRAFTALADTAKAAKAGANIAGDVVKAGADTAKAGSMIAVRALEKEQQN